MLEGAVAEIDTPAAPADDSAPAAPETPSGDVTGQPSGSPPPAAAAPQPVETPGVPFKSESLRKAFEQFGSDEDKLADAFWHRTNENSRMSRELAELRQKVEEFEAQRTAPEPEANEPDPDIAAIDQHLQAIAQRHNEELPAREKELIQLFDNQKSNIVLLNASLERAKTTADGYDPASGHHKTDIERELAYAKRDLDATKREYQAIPALKKSLALEYKRYERDKQDIERRIADDQARQKDDEKARESFQAEFPQKVNGLIGHYAQTHQVPPELSDGHSQYVNANVMTALSILGSKGITEVNIEEIVKFHSEGFQKLRDTIARVALAQASRPAVPAGAKPAARPAATPPAQTPELTPQEREEVEYQARRAQREEALGRLGFD